MKLGIVHSYVYRHIGLRTKNIHKYVQTIQWYKAAQRLRKNLLKETVHKLKKMYCLIEKTLPIQKFGSNRN